MDSEEQRQEFMEIMLPEYQNREAILNYAGNQVKYQMLKTGSSIREFAKNRERIDEERLSKIISGNTFWTTDEMCSLARLFFEDMGKLLPIDYRKLEERGNELYKQTYGADVPEELSVLAITPLLPELYLVDK